MNAPGDHSAAPVQGKTATVAGGALGVGTVIGIILDPDKGLTALKWLSNAVPAAALVAILAFGVALAVSVTSNWLMWQRLKEKDEECRAETSSQRQAWKAVVDSKEADNKEAVKTVTDLLVQVTLLAERARVSGAPTRSS
jgi:hypothetical protein